MTVGEIEAILAAVTRKVMATELDGIRAQIEQLHQRLDVIAPRLAELRGDNVMGEVERVARLNALDAIRAIHWQATDEGPHKLPAPMAWRGIGQALRNAGLHVRPEPALLDDVARGTQREQRATPPADDPPAERHLPRARRSAADR